MLFSLILGRWISAGLLFEADKGGGSGSTGDTDGDTTSDDSTDDKSEDDKQGDDDGKRPEKTFNQSDVDRIVADRLKRADDKAKADADAAKKAAEEKALEENAEFQKLAETRATDLAAAKAENETATAATEATQADLDAHKEALTAILEARREGLNEATTELLDELSPLKQLAWLTKNSSVGTTTKAGVPSTPKPKLDKSNESIENLQAQARTQVVSNF